MCALRDAVLRGAFKGEKIWVDDITDAKIILRKYIDKVLNNEFDSQANHDIYFLEIANKVCEVINAAKPHDNVSTFSFENAQKLINMAVKYTYAFCYQNTDSRDRFQYCHCPLDSIMLDKVWKLSEKCYGGSNQRRENLGKKDEFTKSWGNEGLQNGNQPNLTELPKRYDLFQKAVKNLIGQGNIFPVEFDYIEWR